MNKKTGHFLLILVLFLQFSCKKNVGSLSKQSKGLYEKLSEYGIFDGAPSDLRPSPGFYEYELSTSLFSDYAEKQRLIRLPEGTKLQVKGSGLPNFPEGTIIVKTFYYHKDKRDLSGEKLLLETRILLKQDGKWHAGTYVWNSQKTEAVLFESGLNKTVNWINESGEAKVISYRIPSRNDCVTCHQSGAEALPLGPKVRNLNFEVLRNSSRQNQLSYLQNAGVFETFDPNLYSVLPDWKDQNESLEERCRAYLDVNCGHCHNNTGFASGSGLAMNYELSASEARLKERGNSIIQNIESKQMPRLGTSMIDEEALALLKTYLKSN